MEEFLNTRSTTGTYKGCSYGTYQKDSVASPLFPVYLVGEGPRSNHRYYTNNTGLEAPFAGPIALYIPKTTLLVVSRVTVAAGAPGLKG